MYISLKRIYEAYYYCYLNHQSTEELDACFESMFYYCLISKSDWTNAWEMEQKAIADWNLWEAGVEE